MNKERAIIRLEELFGKLFRNSTLSDDEKTILIAEFLQIKVWLEFIIEENRRKDC